jgi:hypothetical protein
LKPKLLNTILIFIGLIFTSSAQSVFIFNNYLPSSGVDAPVFDTVGNPLAGTNYVAMLYGGATIDSLAPAQVGNSDMPPIPFTYTPNGQSGYFARGGGVEIGNVPCAGYAWLQVRAWDARLGSTYDEVVSLGIGGYGSSSLFYTRGGDGCSATGLPNQPLIGLQSFSLVPEPSTWALLGLGVGFLFWRWRRRE